MNFQDWYKWPSMDEEQKLHNFIKENLIKKDVLGQDLKLENQAKNGNAQVVSLMQAKKEKKRKSEIAEQKAQQKQQQAMYQKGISYEEAQYMTVDISGHILEDWQRFTKLNKLQEWFIQCLPMYTKPNVNYLNNLSEIAAVEKLMGYTPRMVLRGPDYSDAAEFFKAKAKYGDYVITGPEMLTEEHARAIMLLIYNKVKREFTAANLPKKSMRYLFSTPPTIFDT